VLTDAVLTDAVLTGAELAGAALFGELFADEVLAGADGAGELGVESGHVCGAAAAAAAAPASVRAPAVDDGGASEVSFVGFVFRADGWRIAAMTAFGTRWAANSLTAPGLRSNCVAVASWITEITV
jgi:uncharacterized protein YjbI with pentapeptide repeats